MAVKIKLKRLGRTRVPTYRIVVADARTKRDGRAIEEIGKYHPKEEPSLIEVNSERAQHWLSVGAQPTPPVMNILKITGDWQKFKGEPGAEGTLRVREPRADKKEVFAEALKAAGKDSSTDSGSTTPKGGGRTRKSDSKAKADTEAKADASTETKAAKPESGRSKSKASAEKTAAGSADESAAAAATATADTASADTASADTASADTASADTASADTASADTASAESASADSAGAESASTGASESSEPGSEA